MIKSPFLVFQYLFDSDTCARFAETVRVEPLRTPDGRLEGLERNYVPLEGEILEKVTPLIPQIEAHFGVKHRGLEHLVFQQFPVTGKLAEEPKCENAVYKRKKWVKVRDRDLTGILWLKDYQETPPFDPARHVLGGKLEFPVYNFGLQPQRGTLVIYPSCERFISATTNILVGELQCVRFHFASSAPNGAPWIYQPANFQGDFRTWFSNVV